jgi:hypothetical protein
MEAHMIGPRIGNVRNDDLVLIEGVNSGVMLPTSCTKLRLVRHRIFHHPPRFGRRLDVNETFAAGQGPKWRSNARRLGGLAQQDKQDNEGERGTK